MKKTVCIFSNGCNSRSLDCSYLTNYFRLNGCRPVRKPEKADYIIFITCSVEKMKEAMSFDAIRQMSKYRGELIVGGCLPDMAGSRFMKEYNGRYFTTKDMASIEKLFPEFRVKLSSVKDANFFTGQSLSLAPNTLILYLKRKFSLGRITKGALLFARNKVVNVFTGSSRKTASIRIGRGCMGTCTYCSIRKAIGRLQSKPLDDCISEYSRLLNSGYRDFQFISNDVGSYGLDIGSSLEELMTMLSEQDRGFDVRWSLQELHPKKIIEYEKILTEKVKEQKLRYLLCGLQSGSPRILKLMNRPVDVERVLEILCIFRKLNPGITINCHIIIGFPSETDDDFNKSLSFIRRLKADKTIFFFCYEGYDTPASKMDHKVDDRVKWARMRKAAEALKGDGLNWESYNEQHLVKRGGYSLLR